MVDCKCDLGNILDEEIFNVRVNRELCDITNSMGNTEFTRMVDKTDDGDIQFIRTSSGDFGLDGSTPYTSIGTVVPYKRENGPGPEPLINDGILRFTIDTSLSTDTSNEHLKYTFSCGSINSVNDYVIDWGDGNTTIGNNTHYYDTEGIYQIAVSAGASGHFPVCKLGTAGSSSFLKVVSVDTPPDTFYNYVGEDPNTRFFYECRNLVSICSNFFVNNPQMVSLANIFENTYSLKTVPAGLFDNLTELVTVVNMFKNSHIETLPDGLFRYNTKIYGFRDCFYGCEYLTLNKNIFCDEATEKSTRFISPDIIIPYFSNTFQRSNFLGTNPGEAPSLWLYSYNDNRDASDNTCYSGAGNNATSITNYNSIPTTWGGPA